MASLRIGRADLEAHIIGAGLRNGKLPKRDKHHHSPWNLSDREFRDLEAFEAAGWRFRHRHELDWREAKGINGGEIEAGLLARHPCGGLVIVTAHIIARLPPAYQMMDPELGEARPLDVGIGLFDVRLRVPDANLLGAIANMLEMLNDAHRFDILFVAQPLLFYHLVHPGAAFTIEMDPEIQEHWDTIQLETAWEAAGTYGKRKDNGKPIRVAVIDLGFHVDESEIQPNIVETAYVRDDGTVGYEKKNAQGKVLHYVDEKDVMVIKKMPENRHGTLCAGLAGARLDRATVNGAAPECALMLVAVQSVTTQVAVAKAIKICVNGIKGDGADVISVSIGPEQSPWVPRCPALEDEIDGAKNGRGTLGTPIVWACFNADERIPANSVEGYQGVLCVSRADLNDRRYMSGYGAALDLLAPGSDIAVVDPTTGSGVGSASGSSCAAPMVAGVAALVLSVDPTLSASEVIDNLQEGCEYLEAKRPNEQEGWGRLNALNSINLTLSP